MAIAYALLWQLAWFAAILGAAQDLPWLGPVAALPALVLAYRRHPGVSLRLGILALCLGWIVDGVLGLSGMAVFRAGPLDGHLPPPWMLTLWVLYALAFLSCLGWTLKFRWLPPVLAALSAPGAYLGGAALGALVLPADRVLTILAIAVGYGLATALLIRLIPKASP